MPEELPDRRSEFWVLQGDLAEYAIVAHVVRTESAVRFNVLGTQRVDDEFVDSGEFFHELPRVFAVAKTFVNEHGALVCCFCSKQF